MKFGIGRHSIVVDAILVTKLFLLKDSFWQTMKGDKEGLVNQNWTCLTSLFLKLVISTLKKALGGSEAQRSCRDWGWGDCFTSCQQVSPRYDAANRTGPGRALPSRNRQRVTARKRERKTHGRDKASRCLAKKLPMDYKTPTTMNEDDKLAGYWGKC